MLFGSYVGLQLSHIRSVLLSEFWLQVECVLVPAACRACGTRRFCSMERICFCSVRMHLTLWWRRLLRPALVSFPCMCDSLLLGCMTCLYAGLLAVTRCATLPAKCPAPFPRTHWIHPCIYILCHPVFARAAFAAVADVPVVSTTAASVLHPGPFRPLGAAACMAWSQHMD